MLHNIHNMLKAGKDAEAKEIVVQFLSEEMGLKVAGFEFHQDNYSLNSVRGYIQLEPGSAEDTSLFFKFHQEENEEATVKEYYQAHLLGENGYPVDLPVAVSSRPGAQIVVYHNRDWKRLSDICREVEAEGCPPDRVAEVVGYQQELDRLCTAIYIRTLHAVTPEQVKDEPVLQLFTWRLFEQGDFARPGGRVKSFYEDSRFEFPGLDTSLTFAELCALKWEINGVRYQSTLGQAFAAARRLLTPEHLAQSAGLCGHGDAHNANVWYLPPLKYYDPAFAGSNMPALLAEIKPLFHNIFAHADWLYHPEEAVRTLKIDATVADGWLKVTHDWKLNPLREGFLKSKAENVFAPLLAACDQGGMLQADYRDIIRAALFCCPTLVMNLTPNATSHSPQTGLLGLSIAMMMASEPEAGQGDVLSDFLDRISVSQSGRKRETSTLGDGVRVDREALVIGE